MLPILYLLFSSKRNRYTSHSPFSVECLPISAYTQHIHIHHVHLSCTNNNNNN
ncbi:hypothetical protein Hanom_Chr05g00394081 [Helianthus anomalus]